MSESKCLNCEDLKKSNDVSTKYLIDLLVFVINKQSVEKYLASKGNDEEMIKQTMEWPSRLLGDLTPQQWVDKGGTWHDVFSLFQRMYE